MVIADRSVAKLWRVFLVWHERCKPTVSAGIDSLGCCERICLVGSGIESLAVAARWIRNLGASKTPATTAQNDVLAKLSPRQDELTHLRRVLDEAQAVSEAKEAWLNEGNPN